MSTIAVRMIDTIGQRLSALAGFSYWQERPVLSYSTRNFAATPQQRALFKHYFGIDQAPTSALFGGAVIKDAEPGAAHNDNIIALARAGAKFVAYTFMANYGALRRAVDATGNGGNVHWFIADWTASESRALQLLDSDPRIVAVQWTSPTFGGNIRVPGTHSSVRQLNVDLSVGRLDFWLPQTPPPAPKAAKGTWAARYTLTPPTGQWTVGPLPGEAVELASEPLTDYAVVGVNLHTGRHNIKGIDRADGKRLLGS